MRFIITLMILNISTVAFSQETPSNVDSPPIAFGCDSLKNAGDEDLKLCFKKYIANHISSEFQFPKEARSYGVEAKIYVNFAIDTDGNIVNPQIVSGAAKEFRRGSKKQKEIAEQLDREALRVAQTIRIIRPAIKDGKPIRMSFTIPINAILSR